MLTTTIILMRVPPDYLDDALQKVFWKNFAKFCSLAGSAVVLPSFSGYKKPETYTLSKDDSGSKRHYAIC